MQHNRDVGAGVAGGASCASARGRARKFSFAFTAVAMTLPGEYRIGKLALGSAVLLMQGTDNSEATFVMPNGTEANRPQTKSKLIFHCHGNRYFLSQIWVEGNSRGIRLPRTHQEQKTLQARKDKPEEVTIAARLAAPKP